MSCRGPRDARSHFPLLPVSLMNFEFLLAFVVFVGANLYLGYQLLRLFWPLRMLRYSKKTALTPAIVEKLKTLATTDREVRSAVPISKTLAVLVGAKLTDEEMRYRRFWWRSWFYTIASLIFFYTQPSIFGTGADADAFSLALILTESLCAYAQALLVQSVADFRRYLINRYLDARAERLAEKGETRSGRDTEASADNPSVQETGSAAETQGAQPNAAATEKQPNDPNAK